MSQKLNIYFGETFKEAILVEKDVEEDIVHKVITKDLSKKGIQAHYMRMFSEDAVVTTIDYGSWSRFYYLVKNIS